MSTCDVDNLIVLNELRYLVWNVIWYWKKDTQTSYVVLRQYRQSCKNKLEFDILKAKSFSQNPLGTHVSDFFEKLCKDAFFRFSRSQMIEYARYKGVRI